MAGGSCCSTFRDVSIRLSFVCLFVFLGSGLFVDALSPLLPVLSCPSSSHYFNSSTYFPFLFSGKETEPTKHAENTCTHLSAEPKKPNKKMLVHSLGNMDPEISESSPAVFSLAAELRCRFRGYVIYA